VTTAAPARQQQYLTAKPVSYVTGGEQDEQFPTSDTGTRSAVDTAAFFTAPVSPDSWLRIGARFPEVPLPVAGTAGRRSCGAPGPYRRRPDGRRLYRRYELICPSCGDHPYLDFVDVPAQPSSSAVIRAGGGRGAYEHLGLSSCPDEGSPGDSCPLDAKNGVPRAEAANGDSPSDPCR
jgi:hypothetical protein